jgi:hypothetical protein
MLIPLVPASYVFMKKASTFNAFYNFLNWRSPILIFQLDINTTLFCIPLLARVTQFQ